MRTRWPLRMYLLVINLKQGLRWCVRTQGQNTRVARSCSRFVVGVCRKCAGRSAPQKRNAAVWGRVAVTGCEALSGIYSGSLNLGEMARMLH